jgi:hypothetical protein
MFKIDLKDNDILLGWHSNIACWIMDNLGIVDYEKRNEFAYLFIKRFFNIEYDWNNLVNPTNRTYNIEYDWNNLMNPTNRTY